MIFGYLGPDKSCPADSAYETEHSVSRHTDRRDAGRNASMRIARAMYATAAFCVMLLCSCSDNNTVLVPDNGADELLAGAVPVPKQYRDAFEGVYTVTEGREVFGPQVVLKWTGSTLSLFWEREAGVAIFETGLRDTSLRCAGTWRTLTNSETGVVSLVCGPGEGIGLVARGDSIPAGMLQLAGSYSSPDVPQKRTLRLVYLSLIHI